MKKIVGVLIISLFTSLQGMNFLVEYPEKDDNQPAKSVKNNKKSEEVLIKEFTDSFDISKYTGYGEFCSDVLTYLNLTSTVVYKVTNIHDCYFWDNRGYDYHNSNMDILFTSLESKVVEQLKQKELDTYNNNKQDGRVYFGKYVMDSELSLNGIQESNLNYFGKLEFEFGGLQGKVFQNVGIINKIELSGDKVTKDKFNSILKSMISKYKKLNFKKDIEHTDKAKERMYIQMMKNFYPTYKDYQEALDRAKGYDTITEITSFDNKGDLIKLSATYEDKNKSKNQYDKVKVEYVSKSTVLKEKEEALKAKKAEEKRKAKEDKETNSF